MENRTNMKNRKLILLVFIAILFGSLFLNFKTHAQEGVYYSPTSIFSLNEETNFTVYSTAPLTWKLNNGVNFTVHVNATGLPIGENITIDVMTVYFDSPDYTSRRQKHAFTPMINLTETSRLLEERTILYAPDDVEKNFNMTVVILARSTNITENQVFEAYFPGDEPYIEVKKDVVLPIINLPGFPDITTFGRWIFIFAVSFVLIAFPSILVASFKIQELVKNRSKKGGEKK